MTKIEWTDETWNPIVGCSKISRGCTNCYAEKMAARFSWPEEFEPEGHIVTKPEGSFHRVIARGRWNGKTVFKADRIDQPLKFRKARRIFVCSMGDLFHESVEQAWIDKVFAVMTLAHRHTFQILTKRPERMLEYLRKSWRMGTVLGEAWNMLGKMPEYVHCDVMKRPWPLPNVWLGISAEDQEAADDRIPFLLETPAAVRFVSVEPMLGPINMHYRCQDWLTDVGGIDWVICGGESGPISRPIHPDWARSLRDQCADAGVPFFFKQWGEWEPRGSLRYVKTQPLKGDLLFPALDHVFRKIGKKHAGRELDGRVHDGFPIAAE